MGEQKLTGEKISFRITESDKGYRGIEISAEAKEVLIESDSKQRSYYTFYIESEGPVVLTLKDSDISGYIGQACIVKKRGKLILRAEGKVRLQGSNASFGPCSFGESAAVIAEELEIRTETGGELELSGGRRFSSLFSEKAEYTAPIACKKLHGTPRKQTEESLYF